MGIIEALLIGGCAVQGHPRADYYRPFSIGKPDERQQVAVRLKHVKNRQK